MNSADEQNKFEPLIDKLESALKVRKNTQLSILAW